MGCIRKYIECIQFNDLIIATAVSSRKLQPARWGIRYSNDTQGSVRAN